MNWSKVLYVLRVVFCKLINWGNFEIYVSFFREDWGYYRGKNCVYSWKMEVVSENYLNSVYGVVEWIDIY